MQIDDRLYPTFGYKLTIARNRELAKIHADNRANKLVFVSFICFAVNFNFREIRQEF